VTLAAGQIAWRLTLGDKALLTHLRKARSAEAPRERRQARMRRTSAVVE
jgi:hypothetical protein